MARKIPDRTKRLSYVSRNCRNSNKDMDIISSDDDMDVPLKQKVRNEFSVSVLRKNSEHFETDEDHLYSKSKNVEGHKVKRFDGSRPGCKTRSNTSSKSRDDDFDETARKNERVSLSGKRGKCSSKNAVMARLNRIKKKQYISSLENSNKELVKRNNELEKIAVKKEKTVAALQHEITYLKSLLANSKELSEILKSLKNSTGLPVTSSLKPAFAEDVSNENPHMTLNIEKDNDNRQAHVKRVTGGCNFPILQDDVNLGDYRLLDSYNNEFSYNMDEESYFSFSGESDLSLDGIMFNEDNFDFNSSLFNSTNYDEIYKCKEDEALLKDQDLNEIKSDVGLCVHINKRKISVELCSICNSKAQCQEIELGDSFESTFKE